MLAEWTVPEGYYTSIAVGKRACERNLRMGGNRRVSAVGTAHIIAFAFIFTLFSLQTKGEDTATYQSLVEQGIEAMQRDSLSEAEQCFRSAMQLRPGSNVNFMLFRYIGQIQERRGEDDEALKSYTMGLNLRPTCEELLLDRASLYYRTGQTERAIMDYTDVLELDAHCTNALFMRAHLFRLKREYRRARTDYETLRKLDPTNENALLGLILLNDENSRPKEAMDQINSLIQMHPNNATLYAVRGGMEQKRKQYEVALHDLNTAIELDPKNPDLYVSRSTLYRDMRRKKQMRQDAQVAVTLGADPTELASLLH